MTPLSARILLAHDAGLQAAEIATSEGVSYSHVCGILRRERPGRTRKPRARTSEKPRMVLGLRRQGVSAERIAFLVQVSEQYVYRILAEDGT